MDFESLEFYFGKYIGILKISKIFLFENYQLYVILK